MALLHVMCKDARRHRMRLCCKAQYIPICTLIFWRIPCKLSKRFSSALLALLPKHLTCSAKASTQLFSMRGWTGTGARTPTASCCKPTAGKSGFAHTAVQTHRDITSQMPSLSTCTRLRPIAMPTWWRKAACTPGRVWPGWCHCVWRPASSWPGAHLPVSQMSAAFSQRWPGSCRLSSLTAW